MKNKIIFLIILNILLLSSFAFAHEDVVIKGLEVEKLLDLASGLFAVILFVLTLFSYQRAKHKRLIYVSIAFLLFAIKEFLLSSELLFGDLGWVDPITSVLNFAIMLSFFIGLIKKWGILCQITIEKKKQFLS